MSGAPRFSSPETSSAVEAIVRRLLGAVASVEVDGAWSGTDPDALALVIERLDPLPAVGVPLPDLVEELTPSVLRHSAQVWSPRTAAHLHCPTLVEAAAAESVVGLLNQSLDSFDQAPAATLVEDHLVRWIGGELGLPATRSGVMTSGGTASNLLGLALARNHADPDRQTFTKGLPPASSGWRFVASEAAHFSVAQATSLMGLGTTALAPVATTASGAIDLQHLDHVLAEIRAAGERVVAVVGTAGTTDLGAVDPLDALADRAAAAGAWFHVDACVGSAFVASPKTRPLLAGIDRADSISCDFHKLWWQPIGASALVVRDADAFGVIRSHADYLNREDDEAIGVLNLVTRSLDTSRRFDAFKVLFSLRALGRERMAHMIEHLFATATQAARAIDGADDLELLAEPSTVTVVFRWTGTDPLDAAQLDAINTALQRSLFERGDAIIGRTTYAGRTALKFTFVNPTITPRDVETLLTLVREAASQSLPRAVP